MIEHKIDYMDSEAYVVDLLIPWWLVFLPGD